jgi:hypothetical protein
VRVGGKVLQLIEDQVIKAEFLPGPARIKKFEERRGYFLLEVIIEGTGEYRSLRLGEDQVSQIEVPNHEPTALSRDSEEFFLLVEAHRLRLAHQFDPMLAVSVLERKKLILERIGLLKGEERVESLKELVREEADQDIRSELERRLDELQTEVTKWHDEVRETGEAQEQAQLDQQVEFTKVIAFERR